MKYITVTACLLAFAVALAAMWPQAHPHYKREQPSYSVKDFCRDHGDICRKNRLAHYSTPSPIPSKGYVVVLP